MSGTCVSDTAKCKLAPARAFQGRERKRERRLQDPNNNLNDFSVLQTRPYSVSTYYCLSSTTNQTETAHPQVAYSLIRSWKKKIAPTINGRSNECNLLNTSLSLHVIFPHSGKHCNYIQLISVQLISSLLFIRCVINLLFMHISDLRVALRVETNFVTYMADRVTCE